MRTNTPVKHDPVFTYEGGRAERITPEKMLRRSLMSCLLWEKEFYEDGQSIAERLAELVPQVEPMKVAAMAVEAREQMKLRHAPLFIVREMARAGKDRKDSIGNGFRMHTEDTLPRVIQRADELAEFLAMYWQDGKQPIAHSVRRGLDKAIRRFDEYALAKYDRKGAVQLRDVFRVIHPTPDNAEQSALWKRAVAGTLATPDTWEVELSRNDGVAKSVKWARLISENKLGGLATLRNLRNMQQAGVLPGIIEQAILQTNYSRVLPFRFIAAARYIPHFEGVLEEKFLEVTAQNKNKLTGRTAILIDVSGSMAAPLSAKSDMTRLDAACGVAMVGRELCEQVEVYTFSSKLVDVPNRRGFALRDAVTNSQFHGSTFLAAAVSQLNQQSKYDRLIVVTDEQSQDGVVDPRSGSKAYLVNIASAKNGVGYGAWTHIDGFSEAVFNYMLEIEQDLV